MMVDRKQDLLWIFIASGLILLWGSIPTWAGYQAETKSLRFRGIYDDSQDYAAHIAMMEAGRHGEWAYQFRFTTESLAPAYVRLFYVVLGHLSKRLGFSNEFMFHSARWVLGLIALFALYKLMRQLFPNRFWARVAFLLAAVGSGLGWLQLIFGIKASTPITPIDFWLIDSYVFFSLSVFPHFAFVTAGMCITLSLWLNYLENLKYQNIIWISLIAVLVQFTNPIAFATVDAALLGATVVAWWATRTSLGKHMMALSIIAAAQIPLFIYNIVVLGQDPIWNQYTLQHQTLSPPPEYYLWGFGLFWPFAILGAIKAVRKPSSVLGAAIFWTIAAFLLAYAPLYTQQRFLQNITIPLGILAAHGLMSLFESPAIQRIKVNQWGKSAILLFIFLTSLSSIQLSLGRTLYLQNHPENFYYPASLDVSIGWLREHAQYNDIVLASEETSQVLAQKAGVRVYFGHEMETIDFRAKQRNVQAFFQGTMPQLARSPIRWVVYGPFERNLNTNFQPPNNLELVYDSGEVRIYQVK